jgi:hypothetical protein
MSLPIERMRPRESPRGYSFRRVVFGPMAGGFPGVERQCRFVYTRGATGSDLHDQVSVHVSEKPAMNLSATEKQAGEPCPITVPGASAVYHDGWWTPPQAGSELPVWQSGQIHSVTVRTADRICGIRAPRGVPQDELVRVAESIPFR